MNKNLLLILMISLSAVSVLARHGSNIIAGGMIGTAVGALAGGGDGVVPGLATGMALGAVAEMAEDCHDCCPAPCHTHTTVYVKSDELRSLRRRNYELEEELDILTGKLKKTERYAGQLENKLERLEDENGHLHAKVKRLEHELKQANQQQNFVVKKPEMVAPVDTPAKVLEK